MAIQRGYVPKHKLFPNGRTTEGIGWKPQSAVCGKYIPYDAPSKFTPDSETTAEKTEYFCEECWEQEK